MVKLTKVKQPEPEGFAEFWALWLPYARRNDGRGEARQCFAKHLTSGIDPQDIVDGAAWYLRSLKDSERAYIPMAATWLNRCAYEDFAPKERARKVEMDRIKSRPVKARELEAGPTPEERARVGELMRNFSANFAARNEGEPVN